MINCKIFNRKQKSKSLAPDKSSSLEIKPDYFTKFDSAHKDMTVRVRRPCDSKFYGANMGPTWVLSAPYGPHVSPMNLAIRACPQPSMCLENIAWCSYAGSNEHGAIMGLSGADRTQVGPMLAPWTLLSGYVLWEDTDSFTIHSQYHEYWRPGDGRGQCIKGQFFWNLLASVLEGLKWYTRNIQGF